MKQIYYIPQQVLLKLVQRLASLQHYPKCNFKPHHNNASINDAPPDNKCDSKLNSINKSNITITNNNNNNNNNHRNNNNNLDCANLSQSSDKGQLNSLPSETTINNTATNRSNDVAEINQEIENTDNGCGAKVDEYDKPIANESNMGSNVSRHSGKGLSGRRTQSSGMYCQALNI